jgi:hypothetical protein
MLVFGRTGQSFVFTRSNGQPVRIFEENGQKAEGVIVKIGGWRTSSVFERYAIVSQADIAEALGRPELRGGHSLGHSEPTEANPDEPATV